MDEITFQMNDRIGSTLFNDGVVNFVRILTLFVSTRRLCKKYPDYTLPKFGSVNGISMNMYYYGTSKSSTIWLPNRK